MILTFQNLYFYHMALTTFKLLEYKLPEALYSCFTLSTRKKTLLRSAKFSQNFVYNACWIWNQIRDTLSIYNFGSLKIGAFKNKLKKIILTRQSLGDPVEWSGENLNYKLTWFVYYQICEDTHIIYVHTSIFLSFVINLNIPWNWDTVAVSSCISMYVFILL